MIQQAQQAQNINALYNAAMMGNTTAQQLMSNYLTGAQTIGTNTLAGAQAQAAAALKNAETTGKTTTSVTSGIASMLNNPNTSSQPKGHGYKDPQVHHPEPPRLVRREALPHNPVLASRCFRSGLSPVYC